MNQNPKPHKRFHEWAQSIDGERVGIQHSRRSLGLEWRLGMERQLWDAIVCVLMEIGNPSLNGRFKYQDIQILKVWFWSVVHDRPVCWATERRNWPFDLRRWDLPSAPTLSRRLRSDSVRNMLEQLEQRVIAPDNASNLVWMIDGKPLAISGCSKDRQAGYGRAAGGKAKGYKLHAMIGKQGRIAAWRVAPMNRDERVMARRILKSTRQVGYVVADSNYDSNKLHQVCDQNGNIQLVVPRRYGPNRGHGHRRQTPGRLRSKSILEDPFPEFGESLLRQRDDIERFFGRLCNWGGGLTHLPPWIRTHRRVHRWVQAKLIINALRAEMLE